MLLFTFKLLQQGQFSTHIKSLCHRQPVAGTAKAGGQGSGQGQGQGGKAEAMDESKGLEDFLNTGRTGRRNAMADIGDENIASISTSQLPLDMAKLSCAGRFYMAKLSMAYRFYMAKVSCVGRFYMAKLSVAGRFYMGKLSYCVRFSMAKLPLYL